MTGAQIPARVRDILRPRVSGYFPNIVHESATCLTCATPVDGYARCYRCNSDRGPLTADHVGSSVYAWPRHQSGYAMHGYKAPQPLAEAGTAVSLLLGVAFAFHADCLERVAGRSVEQWATVPSASGRTGEHPFHRIVGRLKTVPGAEVPMRSLVQQAPRNVDPAIFAVDGEVLAGGHVLLLDDTWTTGSRAQSAAGALKLAGAGTISVYTVARWLDPAYSTTKAFMPRLAHPDFDPSLCPWTGGACP
ncbi:hypothetical protein [Blastococcus litoris]|uniref:hypothetical protein n=1 Tax=Blastococcus litoris TaxID=2171622 RepID=UPI000E30258E|nr:hypothetical protein [Blastococcus litoris]